MMVEAGGTEKAVRLLRERRPQGHRGGHRRRASTTAKTWIRRVHRPPEPARSPGQGRSRHRPAEPSSPSSTTQPRSSRPSSSSPATSWPQAGTIAAKAERNDATDAAIADDGPRRAAARAARRGSRSRRSRRRLAALQKKLIRSPHRHRGHPHRRPGPGRPAARSRPRSASSPTAHGTGLFQRGETQVLNVLTLGMPKMDQMLDTLGAGDQEALHAPLQHAAPRQRRDRARGQPQAARDRPRPPRRAGAAAGGALPWRSSPTRCGSSPRCSRSNGSTSMALGLLRRRCR